jgi:hypothetical protein
MPMTKSSLVNRLKIAFGEPPTDEGKTIQQDVFEKMAGAVLDEIQQNGTISTTVTVSGTAAIASGSSAGSWPVVGSGTGTGTIA